MGFHILIVDDEYPIREWLVHTIRTNRADFSVDSASNGEEALKMLHAAPFDLVITDIKMPRVDGLELLQNISASFPGIGTIVLSSYDDYDYVRGTFKYDAADYLLKTEIDTDKFLDTIDHFFQTKSSSLEQEAFAAEAKRLLKTPHETEDVFRRLLSAFHIDLPRNSFFFLLAKHQREERHPRHYFPSAEGAALRFSIPLSEDRCIGCIELPGNPSILSQIQLQTLYLNCLQKYNRLSLLLYTDILTVKSSLLPELQKLCACQELDFYQLKVCNPSSLPQGQDLKLEELYLVIQKAVRKSDRDAVLSHAPDLLDYAKKTFYANIEELKFMCLKIYESVYINNPFYDLAEYSSQTQKFSSHVAQIQNLEELKTLFADSLEALYRQTPESYAHLSSRIAQAVSMIEAQYMKPLSLGTVADSLHVNPEYLSRSFKKEVGINFNTFLNNIRLQKALSLLQKPEILISEIAVETGFQTPAYFSKCFKASFGISPLEWRNRN